jgi:hypothetical protein
MKYIIRESRLDHLMTEYLNSWIENKVVSNHTDFILIEERANDYDEWETLMEYDFSDGRLWVNRNLIRFLIDLFGKNQVETMTFVGKWLGNKFDVEVKYVE